MMCVCCTGEDTRGETVVDGEIPPLVSSMPALDAADKKPRADEATIATDEEVRKMEEADEKRRADEEAAEKQRADEKAAAQAAEAARQKKLEDEARDKKLADEAAAKEAAAKAAVKPPVDEAALPLTFRDASGANTYTVNFKSKPLGMDFNQDVTPVKVTKVFAAAKQLGVSAGSELIDIAGTNVEQLGFEQMLVVLKQKIAPLSPDGLVITFRDGSGKQRPIVFPTKPLGMEFNDGKKPIAIKKVSPEAQSLGVEAHWELMSIAGTDTAEMDFDKMLELLRSSIEKLPTRS